MKGYFIESVPSYDSRKFVQPFEHHQLFFHRSDWYEIWSCYFNDISYTWWPWLCAAVSPRIYIFGFGVNFFHLSFIKRRWSVITLVITYTLPLSLSTNYNQRCYLDFENEFISLKFYFILIPWLYQWVFPELTYAHIGVWL